MMKWLVAGALLTGSGVAMATNISTANPLGGPVPAERATFARVDTVVVEGFIGTLIVRVEGDATDVSLAGASTGGPILVKEDGRTVRIEGTGSGSSSSIIKNRPGVASTTKTVPRRKRISPSSLRIIRS